MLNHLALCSGYGGFELGLRLAGVRARTVCNVERDAYAAAVLVARMQEGLLDECPIWSDLTTFDGRAWRGRVDLISAGFPCQPFSAAGQGRGTDDERWIWPDIAGIIADVGPRFVFLENVAGLVRHGLPYVLADLANLGFDAEWGLLAAAEVGAPHRRERFWLLAVRGDGNTRASDRRSGVADSDWDGLGRFGRQPERDRHPRGDTYRRSGEELADPNSPGLERRNGARLKLPEPSEGSETLGDPNSPGRSTVPGSAPGDETTDGFDPTNEFDGTIQNVADPESEGLQGRGRHRIGMEQAFPGSSSVSGRVVSTTGLWPPGRDPDVWGEWVAAGGPEPSLRRVTDGPPRGLADALHLGGNGLVPLCAGVAFQRLAARLGLCDLVRTDETSVDTKVA